MVSLSANCTSIVFEENCDTIDKVNPIIRADA